MKQYHGFGTRPKSMTSECPIEFEHPLDTVGNTPMQYLAGLCTSKHVRRAARVQERAANIYNFDYTRRWSIRIGSGIVSLGLINIELQPYFIWTFR